jgi:hypothetical protein
MGLLFPVFADNGLLIAVDQIDTFQTQYFLKITGTICVSRIVTNC